MKKTMIILTTAACAAMLLTGCMSKAETEALSAWTVERYTAQAMAIQQRGTWREMLADSQPDGPEIEGKDEENPAPAQMPAQAETEPQETEPQETEPQETAYADTQPDMAVKNAPAASEPDPAPEAKAASAPAPAAAEPTPIPKSEWPYITCPPEPTPIPQSEWPYITCPPEPTPEPSAPMEPDPTPAPTTKPIEPAPTPIPTPEPAETPPAMPEPTPTPSGGYAVCSCGATLTPEELLPHMKAHAMNGESHSYTAN